MVVMVGGGCRAGDGDAGILADVSHVCALQVREKIEMSGRDARWEFPKQMLFARTNYMAEICTDLIEMVEIVDDFFKFLGPELKAVTGDTQGIDRVVQRVRSMYEPIEAIQFNVFDYGNSGEWKAMKAQFYTDNEDIKNATRELIDTSFRKLRSAEGACELLQSFKQIKSKGAIQKQVMNKFNDILEQFAREIEQTTDIFDRHKESPPVTKNQPPVAGAIKWSRSLLARCKQTMIKLQSTEEEIIRNTEIGQSVEQKFKTFAKGIMYCEKRWFSSWSESINTMAMQHLKQPIFRRSAMSNQVEINFHSDLIKLIRETRYLDRMGFPIPEIALNVALQEDKYHQWLEGLGHMVEHYYEVIGQLTPVERELLAKKLEELEQSLQPGFTILNWNSLGIAEFIQASSKSINTFQQVVKQVQKNSGIIEQVVYAIAGAQIINEPPTSECVASAHGAGGGQAALCLMQLAPLRLSPLQPLWPPQLAGRPAAPDPACLPKTLNTHLTACLPKTLNTHLTACLPKNPKHPPTTTLPACVPACRAVVDVDVPELQEFYEFIEKSRVENVDKLVKKYRTISPLLGKVEEVVAGTNTGVCGCLPAGLA